MLKNIDNSIKQTINLIKQGGIIAYPTEAVYGLGCDPFNEQAVLRLLALKKRTPEKGLILIAATWEQIEPLIQKIPAERIAAILKNQSTHITWVFPASKNTPIWIRGLHSTVALRLIKHPLAKKLCLAFGGPIVSTSANIEGQTPARTKKDVLAQFPNGIDLIIDEATGGCKNPSEIRDAMTGKVIRQG